ncbi:MAG: hypothetical protein GY724_00490 [Actinomycetia bacterium]|nr:hypothetical protein [Actinomycetes bacterium]
MGLSTFRIVGRSAVIIVLSLAGSACVSGRGDSATTDDTTAEMAPMLEIVGGSPEIYCDNTERLAGEIHGAEPGENIVLSSPQPIQLSAEQLNATADADGVYRLTWRCGPTEVGQPWELRVQGQDSGRRATVFVTGTIIDPDIVDTLVITLVEDTFVCDGSSRDLGELSNATAWEAVAFTAERADDLVDGNTSAEGHLTLTWQCSPDEATTWQVTARGLQSDRVGEFTIVGVAPSPEELLTPTVQVNEDPFLCDDGSRVFATLSGFLPDETVDFVSPQASGLREGHANHSGDLPLRWTCGAADAGTVWELTATGAQSRRSVTFALAGAAAPPAPDPIVTITEDPFQCDDTTRFFATISGFTSREFVDFTSPQAEHLRQGQADETGVLQVRWTCGADGIDQIWDITATGATSQREVSFKITGTAPQE